VAPERGGRGGDGSVCRVGLGWVGAAGWGLARSVSSGLGRGGVGWAGPAGFGPSGLERGVALHLTPELSRRGFVPTRVHPGGMRTHLELAAEITDRLIDEGIRVQLTVSGGVAWVRNEDTGDLDQHAMIGSDGQISLFILGRVTIDQAVAVMVADHKRARDDCHAREKAALAWLKAADAAALEGA